MGKWIRKSLFAKLFLAILLAASLLSLAIYGIVMLYLPASYSQRESARFEAGLGQLARLVENRPLEEIQADLELWMPSTSRRRCRMCWATPSPIRPKAQRFPSLWSKTH